MRELILFLFVVAFVVYLIKKEAVFTKEEKLEETLRRESLKEAIAEQKTKT